jgi:hypothetical protein
MVHPKVMPLSHVRHYYFTYNRWRLATRLVTTRTYGYNYVWVVALEGLLSCEVCCWDHWCVNSGCW